MERITRTRLVCFLVAVLLAGMACTLPGTPTGPGEEAIQTGVAAKLTELAAGLTPGAPVDTPTSTAPVPLPATDTPFAPPEPHQRIVFVLAGNVWIKDQANPLAQLTFSGDAVDVILSDDGLKIAYRRQASYSVPSSIGVLNSDGTGDHVALTGDALNALYPLGGSLFTDISSMVFVPGSHRILVTTKKAFDGPGLVKNDDVLQLDADSGSFSALLGPGSGGDVYPSPNGAWMAISRGGTISLAYIDGSGLTAPLINFPSVITYSEYAYYPPVVWRPDSGMAGVIIPSADPMAAAPTGSIWQINPAASTAAVVTTLDGQFFFPHALLSPALTHIGYTRLSGGGTILDLYVAELSGPGSLHLATGSSAVTGWSFDGQHFSYYMDSPRAYYVGSLGGGTVAIGTNLMTLQWVSATQFLAVTGDTSSWFLRLGDSTGATAIISAGSGNVPAFAADF